MYKKLIFIFFIFFSIQAQAHPIFIVAAENFYGQIAKQIGGPYVKVTSILNNPKQDPHLFSTTPKTAKLISTANIIIYNGINYDPWVDRLLATRQSAPQTVLNIGKLLNKKPGDNPHLWYHPMTMLIYANALTRQLIILDPKHRVYFQTNLNSFRKQDQTFTNRINQLRIKIYGTPMLATEPVFNYMAEALGLKIYGQDFQLSIMNDTEPSPASTRQFEDLIRNHLVRVLIYNIQTFDPLTEHMKKLAQNYHLAIVGVSETQPAHSTYFDWMLAQLNDLGQALKK